MKISIGKCFREGRAAGISLGICVLLLPGVAQGQNGEKNETFTQAQYQEQADKIHRKYITLDSHNDTAGWLIHPEQEDYSVQKGQVTFEMMKEGGLDCAFFAIYLEQNKRDPQSLDSAYHYAKNELQMFKQYVADHADQAEIAYTPEDIARIKKAGKSAVVLAIENGYALGDKLERVDEFYDMGVRYITLCHNGNNELCDASMDKTGPEHGGLSDFGRKVVRRMNELGMMVDISHAASSTVKDVLECSLAPIIASHSGVWAIKNHKRNLKDEELKAIAAKGGNIQVATGRFFLSTLPKKEVTVKHLADHIDHVRNQVGIEHTGLGTDFDGGGGVVGLENVSKMKALTIELLKRGYTPEELGLFWGGNLLRVWKKVEEVAKSLKK